MDKLDWMVDHALETTDAGHRHRTDILNTCRGLGLNPYRHRVYYRDIRDALFEDVRDALDAELSTGWSAYDGIA